MSGFEPMERRRRSTRDEIEAATPAETEAVLVLVEELPYEFVAHESSAVVETDKINNVTASDPDDQAKTKETVIRQIAQLYHHTPDDVAAEKSSSSAPSTEDVTKPCALCLRLVASDDRHNSCFLEGHHILNNICTCFNIKRTPCLDTSKDLSICPRCSSLISDALDYRRTLERVKQLLDEVVTSLQEVLLGSCKEQIEEAKTSNGLRATFDGEFGKFRLALLNCWNGTKWELKKHSINSDGSTTATSAKRAQQVKPALTPPQQRLREQSSGGRVLRRSITKPSYFRDMIAFDQIAVKTSLPDEQNIGNSENPIETVSHRAPKVQPKTKDTLLKTELPSENTDRLTDMNDTSDDEDAPSDGELLKPKKLKKSRRRYDCSACSLKFASIKKRALHASDVHGMEIGSENLSCRFCSETFQDAFQPQEPSDSNSKDFVCTIPQCGKRYPSLASLHLHHERTCSQNPKARSSETPKLSCSSCGKEFLTQVALQHHIKSIHEKSFKLCCEICGLGFQAINMLKRHVMYVHSSEKRYECEVCQAKFKRSHQLLYHRRKHTGELPFKCDICSRAFKQPDKLKQHMAVHASKETPCPMCNKMFASKQYVTNHIRDTHKGVRKHKPSRQSETKNSSQPRAEIRSNIVGEAVPVPAESVTVIVQSSEPIIQEGPTEEIISEEFSFQRIA